jgi:predicted transcriptional regulator
MKILTKGFLEALNEHVNGDETKCIDETKIFEETRLMAFGSVVIPAVVQELVDQGLIRQCVTRGGVKITRKGKNRLERTIDGNIDLVLNTLAKTIPGQGTVPYDGRAIQELTDLTPNEINEAVGLLEEAGFVTLQVAPETDPFSFH